MLRYAKEKDIKKGESEIRTHGTCIVRLISSQLL